MRALVVDDHARFTTTVATVLPGEGLPWSVHSFG